MAGDEAVLEHLERTAISRGTGRTGSSSSQQTTSF